MTRSVSVLCLPDVVRRRLRIDLAKWLPGFVAEARDVWVPQVVSLVCLGMVLRFPLDLNRRLSGL